MPKRNASSNCISTTFITGPEIPKPDNTIPVASHPVSRNVICSAIKDNLAMDPTKHVTNHDPTKVPTDNIHLRTTPARTFADVVRSDPGTLHIRNNAQFAPPKPKVRNAVHVVQSFHARTKEKLTRRFADAVRVLKHTETIIHAKITPKQNASSPSATVFDIHQKELLDANFIHHATTIPSDPASVSTDVVSHPKMIFRSTAEWGDHKFRTSKSLSKHNSRHQDVQTTKAFSTQILELECDNMGRSHVSNSERPISGTFTLYRRKMGRFQVSASETPLSSTRESELQIWDV